jgi:uncharacterized protein (TIGR03118 family)
MKVLSRTMKLLLAGGVLSILPVAGFAQHYKQQNLFSDIGQPSNADGSAVAIDANLKNAWSLARGAASPWWVNNEGTGTSTLYSGAGTITPLVVTVPNAKEAKGPSGPTGIIFNGTADFNIAPKKPAAFIFATVNGAISGWGPPATPVVAGKSTAVNEVDESKDGAVFTGLTWMELEGHHFLLAANFSQRQIEMFHANFKRMPLSSELFEDDPTLTPGRKAQTGA